MPELLKDRYFNYDSLQKLALKIKDVYPQFKVENFMTDIMDESWAELGLKRRMRHVVINLGKYLPDDYEQSISILDKVISSYPEGYNDFSLMCFPDFVEFYGQDFHYWDVSIDALERYTSYSSSEFAVRPFIINHEDRMMAQMFEWAKHDNAHVRRLASEGCRPQLPWGQALTRFKKDPSPILGILEQLKADPSLYVRKSVANNLNDISKTHPELVTHIAKRWHGENKYTDWIVKHGCRTLLKNSKPEVLAIFGYHDTHSLMVRDFALKRTPISIGESVTFSFIISAKEDAKARMEYGVDYVKANGKPRRKMFQISTLSLKAYEEKTYTKTHSFKDLSTRKHYPGPHSITLIVNGVEKGTLDFDLTAGQ